MNHKFEKPRSPGAGEEKASRMNSDAAGPIIIRIRMTTAINSLGVRFRLSARKHSP